MFKFDDIPIGEDQKVYTRSFSAPLTACITSADDYKVIENFQAGMTDVLQKELGCKTHMKKASKLDPAVKGTFWSAYEEISHKPYQRKNYVFPNGNKAKCFRMVSEQIRCQFLIKQEKQKVADIAKSFEYDAERIDEIIEACHDADLFPSYWWLRDIVKTKGMSSEEIPKDLEFQIDWTTQDKQPIKCHTDGRFLYANCDYGGTWVEMRIPIPPYIKSLVSSFSNPVIYKDKKTGELWVRVGYDMVGAKMNPDSRCGGVLGIDLGFVKAFSGAILYYDGSWRGEFLPSRELDRVMEKHVLLNNECRALREKISAYSHMLGCDYREDELPEERQARMDIAKEHIDAYAETHPGAPDYAYMKRHLQDMVKDRKSKKAKLRDLKEHEAWLYARDIVAHAMEWGVYEIHLEDLRAFREVSGQWDFAKIAFCVANEAELFGISVYVVNAKDTSHENPFTGKKCIVRDDRMMILCGEEEPDSDKDTIDRDLGAALNGAYREPKKARIGAKKVHGSRTSKGSQRFWRDVKDAKEEREAKQSLAAEEEKQGKDKDKRRRPIQDERKGDVTRRPKRACFPRECLAALKSAGVDGSGALNSVASSGQPTIVKVVPRSNRSMRTAASELAPAMLDLGS